MRARFLQETFLSVSLALTTVGPLFAADSSSAISAQSLERFLGSVPTMRAARRNRISFTRPALSVKPPMRRGELYRTGLQCS